MAIAVACADFEICGSGHNLLFYCLNCNRLYCGECSTLTHSRKGALKDHDVEPLGDCLTLEEQKEKRLIEELKQLSDAAEAAAIKKKAIEDELSQTLSKFIAQVERFLMDSQTTPDAQSLHQHSRDIAALLQHDAYPVIRRSDDATIDPVGALRSQLTRNAVLTKQLEKIRNVMLNAAEAQAPNVIEAIYKSVIALKGQESLQGAHHLPLKFFTYMIGNSQLNKWENLFCVFLL